MEESTPLFWLRLALLDFSLDGSLNLPAEINALKKKKLNNHNKYERYINDNNKIK